MKLSWAEKACETSKVLLATAPYRLIRTNNRNQVRGYAKFRGHDSESPPAMRAIDA